ncbi:MAG: diguanylate cyclase [Syntrophomonadaceae bacterium]|nr:diguanylate cyclase [Syntrophomonadaceae bacterium]MDD3023216.1 diguanylate cyclase [Syntrophomonadaceae bacterium]
MRVLIADDDALSRKILEESLSHWGYEPVITKDGDEAWDMLKEDGGPTLVVLDWVMPGMEGIEICQKVRARRTANYIYIILLSAKNSNEDVIKGLESGADDYISKPFHPEELKSRLKIGQRIIELEKRIMCLASTDYLTALLNRRAFMERMEAEINRVTRENKSFGIVIADLDHFKLVNDTYGHQAGDLVLQEFSRCLSSSFRIYDFIGRYGGEEFIVGLPGASSEVAGAIAERVRKRLEQHRTLVPDCDLEISVTASFGITSMENGRPQLSMDGLIKQADSALYMAKQLGRNRVEIFKSYGY